MTQTLRTVLTALLLIGLVAGGAGAAAAEDVNTDIDRTTVINDDDGFDVDDSFNNISTNVLGGQNDDSPVTVLLPLP